MTPLFELYQRMLLIRFFEEAIERLFSQGKIHGTTHLCIGQEASAVGVCAALHEEDLIVGSHRSHGHALARGLSPRRLMAELMGRVDGLCGGRGGTQHFAAMEHGFLGSNGITGGGVAVATGAALGLRMQRRPGIVASFFGDGAMSQGAVHEAMNMGALWGLPVLYVCENNLYGMSTHVSRAVCATTLCSRAEAYCIPSESVDGNDVLAVRDMACALLSDMRGDGGPRFLEVQTYRLCGHSKSDLRVYRTEEEEKEWGARDPLLVAACQLRAQGSVSEADLEAAAEGARQEVAAAVKFAENSPWPVPEALDL